MRIPVLVRLVAPLLILGACGAPSSNDPGNEPVAAPVVFPPADQLIDDRLLVGGDPSKPTVVETAAPNVADVQFLGDADRPTQVRVVFDSPMKTDLPLPGGAWTNAPLIDGDFAWIDQRTLAFTPKAPLPLAAHWDISVKNLSGSNGKLLEKPRDFVLNTRRLQLSWSVADNSAYPRQMAPSEGISLAFNQEVALDRLGQATTFFVGDTIKDVIAGGTPVEAIVGKSTETSYDSSIIYLARPKTGFAIGKVYRLSVAKALTGAGGDTMEHDIVGYYRGPDSLRVTDVSCGWNRCSATDNWSISFNNPIEAKAFTSCIAFSPRAPIGRIDQDGYSLVVHPRDALDANKDYKLVVGTGCADQLGTRLATKYEQTFTVQPAAALLRMPVGSGYVTPPAPGEPLLLRVGAAHTGKLSVGKKRITKDDLPSFLAKNLDSWGGLSLANMELETVTEVEPAAASETTMVDVPVRLDDVLDGKRFGLVYVYIGTERTNYNDTQSERRALLQVTDLGIVAKTGPQDVTVFVSSLTDHRPLAGVTVQLMAASGKVVWTGTTAEDGSAQGPGLENSWEEHKDDDPRVIVVSQGDDLAFLDLTEWDTKTEPYRFNLPYAWDARANQMIGQVFTERGVYRAGETVHVKGFVRLDRGKTLEALPGKKVAVKIVDPVGDSLVQQDLEVGDVGDFELDLPLDDDAAMGSYQVVVEPSDEGAKGSVTGGFRVEAYRANTFEVKVDEAHRDGDKIIARIQGRYYYGAPMGGATLQWWANRNAASFSAPGFDGFDFDGRDHWDYWWEPEGASSESIGNAQTKLDGDGFATIEVPLGTLDLSEGPQRIDLEAEVADVDQQTVTGRASVRIEASDVYAGVKIDNSFAGTGETIVADVVAVKAADGTAAAGVPLKVRWLRRTWEAVAVDAAGGGSTFSNEQKDVEVASSIVTSGAAPTKVSYTPTQSGLYLAEVVATNAAGKTATARAHFWIWGDGASWAEDPAIVQLVADKTTYVPGETAKIIVQSPFPEARAIVTVEKSGVIAKQVLALTGSAPVVQVPITEDMQPNAYVSVMLLGNKKSGTATLPESRIGYTRFAVSTADKQLTVAVDGDRKSYLPGEKVKTAIKVTDSAGKGVKGLVTFMAVDEGVLSLTGYQTPDLNASFYAERPLAVSTNDSRKRVWAKMTPLEDGMKSDWGGDGGTGEATNYRTAFATTAAFLPDVELASDGTAEVEFDLPDNLTTFRLMAVAATVDGHFGSGESKIEVKKPLLVRSGLPRFISAGDSFEARATVQAVDPTMAGPVEVSLSMAGPVELDGPATQTVQLEVGKATPVVFKAHAKGPGQASFGFKVRHPSLAREADAVEVQVPVQWPAVTRTASLTGTIGKNGTKAEYPLQIPDFVRGDVGGLDVTVYSTQLAELIPSLQYLLTYPYGCVEQTTGGTLPLVALRELMGDFALPGIDSKTVLTRAQAGLDRLRMMQTWSGGIAYWPGETNPHPWGSVYAGMALVKASKMPGLSVPQSSIDRLLGYLRDILKGQAAAGQQEWLAEMDVVKPFAAYVLALAGTPEASYHATLFEQRAALPDFGKVLLALAVHEAKGDAKMIDTLLDEVIANVRVDGDRASMKASERRYYWSTMDSDLRTSALLLMALSAARPDSPLVPQLARGILAERKNGEWVSTQENAFAALALGTYFTKAERPTGKWSATVRIGDQIVAKAELSGTDLQPTVVHLAMEDAKKVNGKTLTITRDGDPGPVFYNLGFAYAPAEVPKAAYSKGFTVTRALVHASGPDVGKPVVDLHAGDLVKVTLTVDTLETRRYVAVDDPLPAGLEPVTLDFATTAKAYAAAVGDANESENYWDYTPTFNHVEQKDDRVTLFADYMESGSHTHSYLARATTSGTFLGPATRVHEMYHPETFGQGAAYELVVQ